MFTHTQKKMSYVLWVVTKGKHIFWGGKPFNTGPEALNIVFFFHTWGGVGDKPKFGKFLFFNPSLSVGIFGIEAVEGLKYQH